MGLRGLRVRGAGPLAPCSGPIVGLLWLCFPSLRLWLWLLRLYFGFAWLRCGFCLASLCFDFAVAFAWVRFALALLRPCSGLAWPGLAYGFTLTLAGMRWQACADSTALWPYGPMSFALPLVGFQGSCSARLGQTSWVPSRLGTASITNQCKLRALNPALLGFFFCCFAWL